MRKQIKQINFQYFIAILLTIFLLLTSCDDTKQEQQTNNTTNTKQDITSNKEPSPKNFMPVLKVDKKQANLAINSYADLMYAMLSDVTYSAKNLQNAINDFLANPSARTQVAAKKAWLAARVPYMQLESLSFIRPENRNWGSLINAWAINEGLIDYVTNDTYAEPGNYLAFANIIANQSIILDDEEIDTTNINLDLIIKLHGALDFQTNATAGYHVIEFLLWGQDTYGNAPGNGERSYADYLLGDKCTNGNCERRGTYLKLITDYLVTELEHMTYQWEANSSDNYRAKFIAQNAEDSLHSILHSIARMSYELNDRLNFALETNADKAEQDPFSNNSHNSYYYNALGIQNIYLGSYTTIDSKKITGNSISSLLAQINPDLDKKMREHFANSVTHMQLLVDSAENGKFFDQLIDPTNAEGNKLVQNAINALIIQEKSIHDDLANTLLGIDDLYI